MEVFSMIVRIIRICLSKKVKILLIALNLALPDFLKHDLTTLQNSSGIVALSIITERRWLCLRNSLVSGIHIPLSPLQSLLLLAEFPYNFSLSRLYPSSNKCATGIIVFLSGELELLSAAAAGTGWVARLVSGWQACWCEAERNTFFLASFVITTLLPDKQHIQPGEEKALGRPYSSLRVPEGAYKKAGEGLLTRACSDRTRGNGFKLK